MTVISATPFYNGWSGSDTEATEPWIVVTDDINTTAPEVVYSSLLPSVGDTHPYNPLFVIQQGGISANRQDDNGLYWYVDVNYSLQGGTSSTDGRLVRFRVGTQTVSKAITQCYNFTLDVGSGEEYSEESTERDLPIQNSAYGDYDPADLLSEDYSALLVWSQRERAGFDYVGAIDQQGSLNETDVTILGITLPAHKGLMRKVNPVAQLAGDGSLIEWITDYEVEIADTDHNLRLLDSGFYAFMGAFPPNLREILQGDIYEGDELTAKEKKKGVKVPQLLLDSELMTQQEIETNKGGYYNHYRTKPYVDWNDELDLISGRID